MPEINTNAAETFFTVHHDIIDEVRSSRIWFPQELVSTALDEFLVALGGRYVADSSNSAAGHWLMPSYSAAELAADNLQETFGFERLTRENFPYA